MPPLKTIDLRSKQCPETFLYTKLALEQMKGGEKLLVLFTSGDDAQKVCSSIELEGYSTDGSVTPEESGGYRLVIHAR